MCQPKFLVLLDTDRIKDYVFATNKLREIRGASAILDELNLEATYQMLDKHFGSGNYENTGQIWVHKDKTIKKDRIDWEVIFLGGGAGKILFADKKKAQQFCKELERCYQNETDNAASITAAVVPELADEKFEYWIYRGEKELRKRKDSKVRRLQPLTNPYFKYCESSGLAIAERYHQYATPRFISTANLKKREKERDRGSLFFERFNRFVRTLDNSPKIKQKWSRALTKPIRELLPEDLNAIGEFSNGYIGFIYADGNRMGRRLMDLDLETNPSEKYRSFSETIKSGTESAIFSALAQHLDMQMRQNQSCYPFEILLLGGDDLMVVVPANKAIEIAKDFCDGFLNSTSYKTRSEEETGVSISAGVIITHANYPIHQMMDHAEQLLKSAKELSNEFYQANEGKPAREREINSVDFMVLTGALLQDVKDMRKNEMSYSSDKQILRGKRNLKLYQRPYTTNELGKLIDWIKKFKQSGFPNNKLKAMYNALYRGKGQATLDYLLITSRLPQSTDASELTPRNVMLDFGKELDSFPWKSRDGGELETPFLDLIELYNFVKE